MRRRGVRLRRRRPSRPARSRPPGGRRCARRRPATPRCRPEERADAAASAFSAATTARNPMPRFQVPSVASRSRSPRSASTRNTGGGDQVDRSTSTHDSAGQHAREVGGDAAAGHVAEGVHAALRLGDEAQQRLRVQASRLEQRLAPASRRSRARCRRTGCRRERRCGARASSRSSAARSMRAPARRRRRARGRRRGAGRPRPTPVAAPATS